MYPENKGETNSKALCPYISGPEPARAGSPKPRTRVVTCAHFLLLLVLLTVTTNVYTVLVMCLVTL